LSAVLLKNKVGWGPKKNRVRYWPASMACNVTMQRLIGIGLLSLDFYLPLFDPPLIAIEMKLSFSESLGSTE